MRSATRILTQVVMWSLLITVAGCDDGCHDTPSEGKKQTESSTDEGNTNLTIAIEHIYEDDWTLKGQINNDRDKLLEFEWRLFNQGDRRQTSTRIEPRFSIANEEGRCNVWSLELHISKLISGYTLAQQPEPKNVNVATQNSGGCSVRRPNATFTSTLNCEFREISVDASQSTGDGRLDFFWDFGDGGTSTREKAKYRYADDGPFDVELRVTNAGGSDTDQERVAVIGPAIPRIGKTIDGLCVNFSSDPSMGTIESVLWRFGDGSNSSSTARNPVFCYNAAGTFTARLDVTNECSTETAIDTFDVS